MARPPLLAGAAQVSEACPLPGAAFTFCGAPGTVAGTMLLEFAPVPPSLLLAVTVKVYVVPFVKPVMVVGDAGTLTGVIGGEAVMVKFPSGKPPVLTGAVQL